MTNLEKRAMAIKLVEDDIVNIRDNMEINDVWYLGELLRTGFKGYENYTEDELIKEYNDRGLNERE